MITSQQPNRSLLLFSLLVPMLLNASILEECVGIWKSRSNYNILEFQRDGSNHLKLNRYQYTPISCILEQTASSLSASDLSHLRVNGDFLYIGSEPYQKITSLPKPHPKKPGTLIENFDVFIKQCALSYPFFSLKKIDWQSTVTRYKEQALESESDEDLMEILNEVLSSLKDNNASVITNDNQKSDGRFYRYPKAFQTYLESNRAELQNTSSDKSPQHLAQQLNQLTAKTVTSTYLSKKQSSGLDSIFWGKIKEHTDIGYLRIRHFSSAEKIQIKKFLTRLQKILSEQKFSALIIDLRSNAHGSKDFALDLASMFVDKKTMALSKQYYFEGGRLTQAQNKYLTPLQLPLKMPLFVLIDPATSASAEWMVLALSERITTIGQPTMGMLSGAYSRMLPNGWWYSISNEVIRDRHGNHFESRGIEPNIALPFNTLTQLRHGYDGVLERAIALSSN